MEMVTIPKEEYEHMVTELKRFKNEDGRKSSDVFEKVYTSNVSKEEREKTMEEVKEVRTEGWKKALDDANGDEEKSVGYDPYGNPTFVEVGNQRLGISVGACATTDGLGNVVTPNANCVGGALFIDSDGNPIDPENVPANSQDIFTTSHWTVLWARRQALMGSSSAAARGGRALSTLLNWSFAMERREKWDKAMAEGLGYVLLDDDTYKESICNEWIKSTGENTNLINTPGGGVQIGAHIQMERSKEIIAPNETGSLTSWYFYKITMKVQNGYSVDDLLAVANLSFDIHLYGEKDSSGNWGKDYSFLRASLIPGGSFIVPGTQDIITFYEKVKYEQVCIDFTKDIPQGWRDPYCNGVNEYNGDPVGYTTEPSPDEDWVTATENVEVNVPEMTPP